MNENKNNIPKLIDATKEVLRGKFIVLNAFFKKKSPLNNVTFHLKKLEKEGQTKIKARPRMEIIRLK